MALLNKRVLSQDHKKVGLEASVSFLRTVFLLHKPWSCSTAGSLGDRHSLACPFHVLLGTTTSRPL